MKTIDYLVERLITQGVTDVFGYPGGMVTHLMDSLERRSDMIRLHINYHEQASAFAACSYAQVKGNLGVAFATSGPGATNLITGICNAYFDSIPVLFITGQVNTYESKGNLDVRQKGFQETDIVSMVKSVCKYAVQIEDPNDLPMHLEQAIGLALDGRRGPVLLDIPMNVQRTEIMADPKLLVPHPNLQGNEFNSEHIDTILNHLKVAKRPCLLIGAGVRQSNTVPAMREVIDILGLPVVTSMIAVDVIPSDHTENFGFIGAYGNRYSNFILSKCDLLVTFGSRLDVRQTGANKSGFASGAKILRIDIDSGELSNRISEHEISIQAELSTLLPDLANSLRSSFLRGNPEIVAWHKICTTIKMKLEGHDDMLPNTILKSMSGYLPGEAVVTTDVGQNQVWAAQSLQVKAGQQIIFSGGHGAMGYSLPAAIGAFYAKGGHERTYSINGDGGIQINIQELQFIAREKLPITIIILNNKSLGMIRHFQEMYFNSVFSQTVEQKGYGVPSFDKIAFAYGLKYHAVRTVDDIALAMESQEGPVMIEVALSDTTYVYPKLAYDKPIQDQEPPLDPELYKYLMSL